MAAASSTAKRTATQPVRKILVHLENGRKVLVENIPGNAKVTFGKLQPGPGFSGNALRIYTVESNQLAVFCDVSSFRDLSLTVKEQLVQRRLKENATQGPNGSYGESEYETEYTWDEVSLNSPPAPVNLKIKNRVQPF